MVRQGEGLAKATEFYHRGLGLAVLRATDEWTELVETSDNNDNDNDNAQAAASRLSISLQAVSSEAQVTTGYSPLLQFETTDMDMTIARCVQMGGHLDGPIQYQAHGKVAALRSPDGHMIGLYEPVS